MARIGAPAYTCPRPGEEQGEERGGERRAGARPRSLRGLHRGVGYPEPRRSPCQRRVVRRGRSSALPAARLRGPMPRPLVRPLRRVRPSRIATVDARPEAHVPSGHRTHDRGLRRPGEGPAARVGRAADVRPAARPERRRSHAGRSWTGRSPPTTRWASTTPGAGCTRTSTSASTRCWARTSASRTGSTARACGSRSTSSASWTSSRKRDIESFGIARVREPVQAARAHLRRAPDRAEHPAGLLDGLERPGRAAPAARPAGRGPVAGRSRSRGRRGRSPTPSR